MSAAEAIQTPGFDLTIFAAGEDPVPVK